MAGVPHPAPRKSGKSGTGRYPCPPPVVPLLFSPAVPRCSPQFPCLSPPSCPPPATPPSPDRIIGSVSGADGSMLSADGGMSGIGDNPVDSTAHPDAVNAYPSRSNAHPSAIGACLTCTCANCARSDEHSDQTDAHRAHTDAHRVQADAHRVAPDAGTTLALAASHSRGGWDVASVQDQSRSAGRCPSRRPSGGSIEQGASYAHRHPP